MIPPDRRRRVLLWGGAALLLVLAGAVAAFLVLRDRTPDDVSNPEVAFSAPPVTTPPERPARDGRFDWPFYGYDAARTKSFPLARRARPPFKLRWAVRGNDLLEFSPVAGGSALYLLKNNGAIYAIKRRTGIVFWKEKVGHLAASSPAVWRGLLIATLLEGNRGSGRGRVVALRAKRGREAWARPLPSRTESSPVVVRGIAYFGSENGTIYALRARTGAVVWKTKVSGAVKAGLAYDDGRLFFGTYRGQVIALDARSGRRLWTASGGGGRFYATPAVAFGRVYVGNTNAAVTSFSAKDGKIAWRRATGDFVYSGAATANLPGIGPTVYVGSYDENLYAFNARTGALRWKHRAEGRISGAVQVIGDLVFYSTLNGRTTAVGAATGRRIWSVRRGKFNPVISDGRYLFLNGQTSLFAYDLRPGDGPVRELPGDRPDVGSPERKRRKAERRAREEQAREDRIRERRAERRKRERERESR